VERDDRTRVAGAATFLVDDEIAVGVVALGDSASHHARVKRLEVGDRVRVTNGAGRVGSGAIVSLARDAVSVEIATAELQPRPPAIHLRAPIADRDRMLWLAEKVTELGITSWQAVRFRRSASVNPRGEGPAFHDKVRARMISALEQSGGAWLPSILPDAKLDELVLRDGESGILLDAGGGSLPEAMSLPSGGTPVLLLGPEGGLEPTELGALEVKGWRAASLADTTLRFETAGIAAVAVCRALRR
jgi:16S rRNA (uracil1498-N3)-methyltransferase